MIKINADKITKTVRDLVISANIDIDPEVQTAITRALPTETAMIAREILTIILKNYDLAKEKKMPLCQDTGVAVFFVDVGDEVEITNGTLTTAINTGVKKGYEEGFLRKSMVFDPVFKRINTKTNLPAAIHYDIVPGRQIKITFAPKGGGAENMSQIKMMKPADGVEGIKKFVLESVKQAGGNPCPPIILGIGIGGNFEQSALLAKKALLKPLSYKNPDPEFANLQRELLNEINSLGIGPMGLGGKTTALAVNILTEACHIASMPVAINFQCHCHRHKTIIIE